MVTSFKVSLPIGNAAFTKKLYPNIMLLLKTLQYNKCGWQICADLKVVVILLGCSCIQKTDVSCVSGITEIKRITVK